jgi:hypothetical protein
LERRAAWLALLPAPRWSEFGDLQKCIDTGIGKCAIIDVQGQLLDRRGRQANSERIDKYPIVAWDFPLPLIVAREIACAAFGMLAKALDRN